MKKILNKYAEFGRKISKGLKVKKGYDFYCYPDDNEIHIPIMWNEDDITTFIDNIKTRYNANWVEKIDDYIWCFLHEMGHIKTEKINIIDTLCRPILTFCANASILPRLCQQIYYCLPKEQQATDWAINYVNQHFEEVLQFQKEIRQTYKRYYKTLGVEMV